MARKKKGRLPVHPIGKTAQRYGGGHESDDMGRKMAGLKVGKRHGSSRKQRKIANGRT